jgi:hypothetical protein
MVVQYNEGCDLGFEAIVPCNTLLTLRSRVVLERLILSQPLKKYSTYSKLEGLFLFLQEPTLSRINI